MTSALAFSNVKYAGAAYLVYLGIQALLERREDLHLASARLVHAPVAFRHAVLAELLNPKTALFFLSFLPQFVQPGHDAVVAQLATFGLVFAAMSAAYTALIALAAGQVGRWLGRNRRIGAGRAELSARSTLRSAPGWPSRSDEPPPSYTAPGRCGSVSAIAGAWPSHRRRGWMQLSAKA